MEKKKLTPKQIKAYHARLRAVIQLLYFLFFPSAFTAAFNGVKYIFTQLGNGDKIAITSFVTVLIVLCAYTVVFGRFFCGFACAFGSLGDGVHWVYMWARKKLLKKGKKLPDSLPIAMRKKLTALKYVILFIIVAMCYAGVYSKAQGTSPWDVFSMLHAFNFRLGKYGVGIVLLILIIIGMAVQERFFCRFLCPMGAVFSLMPVLPIYSLHRDRDNCIRGCSACTKKCPSDIELPAKGSWDVCGDCFQCQKCIDTCPKGNVTCGIDHIKGNEFVFTILRAVILLGLYLYIGI